MTPPLRTIVIGFGNVAAGLAEDLRMARFYPRATHAQVLKDHPAFDWQAVVDPSPDACERARRDWEIPHVGSDVETVCAAYEPDVAVIAAPPGERREILEKLPSVRALLVEKPLGTCLSEAEEFLEVCRRRALLVQVNYFRRADKSYRELVSGRLEELIGRAQAIFGVYGRGLHNNAAHVVDLVRMLFGEVVSVQAIGETVPAPDALLEGDVALPFSMNLAQGATTAVMPLDFREYREVGIDVWGTAGRLSFLQEGLGLYHSPIADNRGLEGVREIASDGLTLLDVTLGEAYYAMYDNLAKALVHGETLFSSGESAMASEAVLDAVLQSARSDGQPVSLAG